MSVRVLYVGREDDPTIPRLARADDRFDVDAVTGAAEGLATLQRNEYDCVVAAYDLPNGTGVEFLERVRETHPNLPFILRTEGVEGAAAAALDAGATDVFEPPVDGGGHDVLANRIRNAVERRRSRKQRERELHRKERRFEAMFEDPNILVGLLEPDGTIVDINETAMSYVDADRTDVVGEPFWKAPWFAGDEDAQRRVREWVDRTAAGEYVDFEIDLSASVGRSLVVSGVFRPVTNERGDVVSLLISDRDITARKERERRFEALFQDPNILVGLLEPDGTVVDINETAMSYVDADRADVIGKPMWETPWWDDPHRPEIREMITQAAAGKYVPYEFDLTGADGEQFSVMGTVRPVTDDRDNVLSLIVSARDITERRTRTHELELRTRAMDEAPVGIVITEPEREDNPIVYVNDGFKQLTGYSETEILGRNCRFLQGPLTREEPVSRMREAIAARESVSVEVLNYRKNGTPFWNHVQITPVFDDDGELRHFIGFQNDVTDRVESERRVSVLNRVLRHNIRNDLNVILGHLANLEDRTDDDESVRTAYRTAVRLLQLSEKARDVESVLRAASFQPRSQDLASLLGQEVASRREAFDGVSFETSFESDSRVLATDSVSLALRELLDNAAKHGDDGTVSVRTETGSIPYPPDGNERAVVTIHIEDTNPSLADDERVPLLGEAETPIHHGEGLGLWLVNWLVTMSGGMITHEPLSPRGNRVSVTLLREQEAADEESGDEV